ncbi:MAG: hypothetical protein HWD62_00210 [Cyclobacteriaceae bacterium]|nr:MAG: hypothetical protein HWD62_00210 [Cyclobacteriaceae bacterium]
MRWGAVTNIEVTGLRGSIQGWEKAINAGGFVADGTLGVANPLVNPPVPLVSGVQTTYRYRAVVQNGTCAPVYSPVATVVVNPIPPQPTISPSGATTFCDGGSVTLTSSNVGGLAASFRWYRNGVFTGTTTSSIVVNTTALSGSYTVEALGVAPTACPSPLSDPVVVTINPLPTATVSGGGSVCSGTPAPDIVWTFTGTPPFDFTITVTPGVPINVTGHNAMTYTIVAPNPPVNTTYTLTSLVDNNSCPGTSLGGAAAVNIQSTPSNGGKLYGSTGSVR